MLLTQERLRSNQVGRPHLQVLCLDADWGSIAGRRLGPRAAQSARSRLCHLYLGFDRRTQGCGDRHRELANMLARWRAPGLDPEDKMLAITTLTFDIAGLELSFPSCGGTRRCAAVRTPRRFRPERLELSGATVMQATPATWGMLLDAGWSGARAFVFAAARPGDGVGGPVDARGGGLEHVWPDRDDGLVGTQRWTGSAILIGRPIANTRFYVLDGSDSCAGGRSGRIYIGGDGLAQGYLRRPEFTCEDLSPIRSDASPARAVSDRGFGSASAWRGLDIWAPGPSSEDSRSPIELGEIKTVLASFPA